jgi:hypothetical protein
VANDAKLPLAVERWFSSTEHPLESAMRRVAAVILGADRRMTAEIRYGTVQFVYRGGFANFVQVSKKHQITVMFNVGKRIPGIFPHLEGDGPNARFMRFASLTEVNARAGELKRIAVAWCAMQDRA